ncbi:hypothetical protein MIR68_009135 [Amoeboaphelidium protococcarum]|nr:hypothetical protein MIR68_009135 [Amoeboaphelidium protococcarum]
MNFMYTLIIAVVIVFQTLAVPLPYDQILLHDQSDLNQYHVSDQDYEWLQDDDQNSGDDQYMENLLRMMEANNTDLVDIEMIDDVTPTKYRRSVELRQIVGKSVNYDDGKAFDMLVQLNKYFLGAQDNRAYFSQLYVAITNNALKALDGTLPQKGISFKNETWVRMLIGNFADYYRHALYDQESGNIVKVPRSWRAAFQYAQTDHLSIIQHLLLGVNAHINHDLAFSVNDSLRLHSEHHRHDYQEYNKLVYITAKPLIESLVKLYTRDLVNLPPVITSILDRIFTQFLAIWRNIAWHHGSAFASSNLRSNEDTSGSSYSICGHRCQEKHYKTLHQVADVYTFIFKSIFTGPILKLIRSIEGQYPVQTFCKYNPWNLC